MSRSWTTFVKKNSWNSLQNKPAILSDNQISFSEIINKPTTLSGYGITDAQPLGNELTAIQALGDTTGFLKKRGNGDYSIDTNSYFPLAGGTVSGGMVFAPSGIQFPAAIIIQESSHSVSNRAALNLADWQLGQDTAGDGTRDFFIYEAASARSWLRVAPGGNASINGVISCNGIAIPTSSTIFSSTATGNTGTICWDSNYIYVCTATNTWKRTALSSW